MSVIIKNSYHTPDGFATGRIVSGGRFCFFETIDLHSYPSCNDFKGKTTVACEGDVATVYKFLGRPSKIRSGDNLKDYDVYEILIHGAIRHAFRQNLAPLNTVDTITYVGTS